MQHQAAAIHNNLQSSGQDSLQQFRKATGVQLLQCAQLQQLA
jgi:hypothetical protein